MNFRAFLADLTTIIALCSPLIVTGIWFAVSLVRFLKTPEDAPDRKRRKVWMIASSIVFGIVLAANVTFIVTLALALRNM